VSADAVVPTARAARLPLVALGPLAAIALVALAGLDDDPPAMVVMVVAALVGATGVGVALDDSAANVLASSPTALAIRRGTRIAMAVGVALVGWLVVLEIAATLPDASTLPRRDLSLEFVGLVAASFALSVVAGRVVDGPGGTIAALALVPSVGMLSLLGQFYPSLPLPQLTPGVHPDRWWWVIAVSFAVVGWSCLDPGRAPSRALGRPNRCRKRAAHVTIPAPVPTGAASPRRSRGREPAWPGSRSSPRRAST
jgi:hypothetical protein